MNQPSATERRAKVMIRDAKTLVNALDGLSLSTPGAEGQLVVLDVHTRGPRSWRLIFGLYGPQQGLFSVAVDPAFEVHEVVAAVRTCVEDWLLGRRGPVPERHVQMAVASPARR